MKLSLRKKVSFLLFVYALILVVFFTLSMIVIAYVIEDEVINKRLLLEAEYLKTEYVHDQNVIPRGKHFTLYFSLEDLPQNLRKQVFEQNFDREVSTEDGKNYHYFHFYIAIDREAYLVVDASDISLIESISADLLIVLGAFLLITLLLSIGLTLLISNKVIKPFIKLSNIVKDSHSAIPNLPEELLSRGDEVGFLANSLKSSYSNLSLAIERESEFTQDVSHELRTPISVMMNTLTLAQGKPLSVAKQEVLGQQVNLMSSRVQILLALARAESIKKKRVSLLAVVEESILSIHKVVEENSFNIVIDIPISSKVMANEQLITLMFANLIENAIKYSNDNGMHIEGTEKGMSISNQTNAKITEDVMKKSSKAYNSDGLGQGLFLVTRILESTGWSFELAPSTRQFDLKIIF
jgi:signal transduction histidine kinase